MKPEPINNLDDLKRILEAALLAAEEPLALKQLARMFEQELSADMLRRALEEIRQAWEGKGVELAQVADGWRFQTTPEVQSYLVRLRNERPPRYSRAVMETLAIIAYRQPVTRGDIEDIRGVSVNAQIIKTLEARGWIETIGHRDVPGRPALYATTSHFLSDLSLRSLQELPPLQDLGSVIDSGDAAPFEATLNDVPPVVDEDDEASRPQASPPGTEGQACSAFRMADPEDDSHALAAEPRWTPGLNES
jgi:segregation and condensation protein B